MACIDLVDEIEVVIVDVFLQLISLSGIGVPKSIFTKAV